MMEFEGFAVDISNWSGMITPQSVDCWKRDGVKRVIVGTQDKRIMRWQMAQVADAGLELEAYVFLYDQWRDFADQVRDAYASFYGRPVKRLWLDCEFATTAPPDVVVEKIWNAVNYCEKHNIPYGIYTGTWWWLPKTNNSAEFGHVDLWHSRYFDLPPNWKIQEMGGVHYGGWKVCQMWQYRGSTMYCGTNVDFNYFYEERAMEERIRELEAFQEALHKQRALIQLRVDILEGIMDAALKGKWRVMRGLANFMLGE